MNALLREQGGYISKKFSDFRFLNQNKMKTKTPCNGNLRIKILENKFLSRFEI